MDEFLKHLITYPMPNRPGFWAYRKLPNGRVMEVELTKEEWFQLHNNARDKENQKIRKLNEHPLNQAALTLLKKGGEIKVLTEEEEAGYFEKTGNARGNTLNIIYLLSLAERALPVDESSNTQSIWESFAQLSKSASAMGSVLKIVAQEVEAEDLLSQSPLEAARRILEILEIS